MKIALLLSVLLVAFPALAGPTRLTSEERESLRYRLENLYNEVDLVLRNQVTDRNDVSKQYREMEALRVYERIPFKDDIAGLKKDLTETAKRQGLTLTGLRITGRSGKAKPAPRAIYSDAHGFKLQPDQVAQEIRFVASVKGGDEAAIRKWMNDWADNQLRLVEAQGGYGNFPVKRAGKGWQVRARAFRYRELEFPRVLTRDPFTVLPVWAKQNPQAFAKAEPILWGFVERTRELAPKARPLFDNRREFLLLQARMDYFVRKAAPLGPNAIDGHAH